MGLQQYHKKRNFNNTREPSGKVKRKSNKKHLFIIQKHAASNLHYDFRLELNGVLLSWAVPKGPSLDPSIKRLAMHVEDHPLEYGSFEGTIPKGQYGGGTVILWDKGEWRCQDINPALAYKKGSLTFKLHAKKLNGLWKLIRMHNNDKTWLLIKINDKYAKTGKKDDILTADENSVKTGKTLQEVADSAQTKKTKRSTKITKEKINKLDLNPLKQIKETIYPKTISPALATLVNEPPKGESWVHEIKFDGYRLITFIHDNKIKLMTRHHHDWTHKFGNIITQINRAFNKNVILDGEIVVLDKKNKPNFQLLQNALNEKTTDQFIYYVFDILYYDHYLLTNLALIERKALLQQLLPKNHPILRYSAHIEKVGKDVFKSACQLGLEGIISKNKYSVYQQKRTHDWLKTKCIKQQEFVIGGYTLSKKTDPYFGSLLLGSYNAKRELIYHGNVGTGFTQASLNAIFQLLQKYKQKSTPFDMKIPKDKNIVWVKPKLIAAIEFTEWTQDGALRHPSFKSLRSEKGAKSMTKENAVVLEKKIKKNDKVSLQMITHPQKIIYQEDRITKIEIAEYYAAISQWMLPYVNNRPLTLVRCPENYTACFYQKHIKNLKEYDHLYTKFITEKKAKGEYVYIKDEIGLITLVQMGILEIHPWGSTVSAVEKPDTIIFDLDSGENVEWKEVVTAAFEVKKYLEKLKLKCFVKTTGGKGLHVVIPIKPVHPWHEIKIFTHALVDTLLQINPNQYVGKMNKALRNNKIFIDYLRNQKGATAIAPYSTRARSHASVATPLHWDELSKNFKDNFYTVKNLPKRMQDLKNDPWADYKHMQKLKIK